jgi:hypothetical protein
MSASAPAKGSHTGTIVTVGVIVIIVVVFVGLWAVGDLSSLGLGGGLTKTDITAVNWDLTGSSCSGDPTQSTTAGQTVNSGSTITVSQTMVNTALGGSCTFQNPSVSSGFSISSSNTPLTVNAGGTQTLQLQVVTPTGSWTGVLTVTLSVTTAL